METAATLQERWKGLLPDLLGIELTEVTSERVAAVLTVRDEICTIGKVLHGGAIMAFADTLGAVGTFVNLPPGARTTTVESKTNFIGRLTRSTTKGRGVRAGAAGAEPVNRLGASSERG